MNIKKLPIACGKHIHQLRAIDATSLPIVDKVREFRLVLDDAMSCRVCSQVRELYAGYRRRGWRTCLLCGAQIDGNKQRLDHEQNHPLPPEAEPSSGCTHGPLGIRVGHRGAGIVERSTKTDPFRRAWDIPLDREHLKTLLRIIEEENGGSVHRNGWYYPRTRASAAGLEDLWHHPLETHVDDGHAQSGK